MSKAYCGIAKIPKGYKRGSMKDCAEAGQIRYYGLKKIDSKLVEHSKKSKKGQAKRNTIIEQKATIKGKINITTKNFKAEKDPKKKKLIGEQYKKLVIELKKLNAELEKISSSRISSKKRSKSRKGSMKSRKSRRSNRSKKSKSRKRSQKSKPSSRKTKRSSRKGRK